MTWLFASFTVSHLSGGKGGKGGGLSTVMTSTCGAQEGGNGKVTENNNQTWRARATGGVSSKKAEEQNSNSSNRTEPTQYFKIIQY